MVGKLEKLEEELYGKGGEGQAERRMYGRIDFPGTLKRSPGIWRRNVSGAPEDGTERFSRRVIKWFFVVISVLFLALGAVFLFFYLGTRGQEAEIVIHGRDAVESGELLTIPITFRNKSRDTLQDAELTVILPPDSLLVEGSTEMPAPQRIIKKIDDLPAGEEIAEEITVRFFGREGEEKRVEVLFLYRPESFGARFSARQERTFFISRVPLALAWDVPDLFSEGQETVLTVRYISDADRPFENISFRFIYPPGFTFTSADPKPDIGDTLWKIGTLKTGEGGSIKIRGIISGAEGEIKTFRGELGVFDEFTKEFAVYSESSKEAQMATAPLSVRGLLAGARDVNITPGEQLRFSVKYKNNTRFVIRNVSVRAFLEGNILEFGSLDIGSGGVFDAPSRSVVWGPSSVPELREVGPGEGGEFEFQIRARTRPVVRTSADYNQTVFLRSSASAASIPQELAGTQLESRDELTFKVNSLVLFYGRALFRSSPILNSGPLPPRLGSETSYTVIWEVRNFTGTVHNAEIRAALPPNVRWAGVVSPEDARVTFDSASGEVRWRLGTVGAGTGVIAPALVGAFKILFTPSEADIGNAVTLLSESLFSGTDAFTGREINERVGPLTTELREDPTTTSKDWRVIR